MTSLTKYYRNAAIVPFGIIAVLGIVSGVIHDLLGIGKDYKSEWFTDDGYWLSVLFAIILSLFICLLSATIFLNRYVQVKNSLIWSFLTWFLLPMCLIGNMLIKHLNYVINYQDNFDSESIFVLSITLPHLIGLCFTFIKFRFENKK